MLTIFTPLALLGQTLTVTQNVKLLIDDDNGIIVSIKKVSTIEEKEADIILPQSSVLLPSFINSHTHIADAYIKDKGYNLELEEVFSAKGLKNEFLNSVNSTTLHLSLTNSLEQLTKNGFSSFLDFREGGVDGVNTLIEVSKGFNIRPFIFARPLTLCSSLKSLPLDKIAGFGFADVFSFNTEIVEEMLSLIKTNPKLLSAIHLSENELIREESFASFDVSDIVYTYSHFIPSIIVHGTYIDIEKEISYLKNSNTAIISCPLTNLYYGLKFPPLTTYFQHNIPVGLGTDNVMTTPPDPFKLMSTLLTISRSFGQKFEPIDILKSLTVTPGIIVKQPIGQITENFFADMIAIDLDSSATKFSKDVYSAISLRSTPIDIIFQMFNGKVIK